MASLFLLLCVAVGLGGTREQLADVDGMKTTIAAHQEQAREGQKDVRDLQASFQQQSLAQAQFQNDLESKLGMMMITSLRIVVDL